MKRKKDFVFIEFLPFERFPLSDTCVGTFFLPIWNSFKIHLQMYAYQNGIINLS